ncbi:DNA-binding protein rfx2 [Apophysomyces sp. BC1034]|nr:DNA-binding protein rfx2 [Apophysomyces sp. BC1015]KAG0178847.1 DNA-binding protein rfx2 [Apophysomyces sp. BC1021]KAG0189017.1 DNA-binding protein rfx2 [Apophysomyces sp. BC1034]
MPSGSRIPGKVEDQPRRNDNGMDEYNNEPESSSTSDKTFRRLTRSTRSSSREDRSSEDFVPSRRSSPEQREEEHIALTDKATSQLVTHWVRENYQYQQDHNVPRRGMYEHYKTFCRTRGTQPVNSATFGKLIRTVFPEIKTRRLGTRGQSKYHYCGICMRSPTTTELSPGLPDIVSGEIVSFDSASRFPNSSMPMSLAFSGQESSTDISGSSLLHSVATGAYSTNPFVLLTHEHQNHRLPPVPRQFEYEPHQHIQYQQGLQYEYNRTTGAMLPPFSTPVLRHPDLYEYTESAEAFTIAYENHCREELMLVTTGQFTKIKPCLAMFYQAMPANFRNLISNVPEMVDAIWRWDSALYDTIISSMLPIVYTPLSQEMVRGLRQYTRELEDYINLYLKGFLPILNQKKSGVARIFVAKFRRHLSLNHMAQAAAETLRRPSDVHAMQGDWEKVDFGGVLDQALWICDCKHAEIEETLQHNVSELLRSRAGLEHWMAWVEKLIDRHLSRFASCQIADCGQFLFQARQLILKWSFYTSLIMRDLTMRKALTFASFHVLRLFLDDYALYLVEERIARMNAMILRSGIRLRESSGTGDTMPGLNTPPSSAGNLYKSEAGSSKPQHHTSQNHGRIIVLAYDHTKDSDAMLAKAIRAGLVQPEDDIRICHIMSQTDYRTLFSPLLRASPDAKHIEVPEDDMAFVKDALIYEIIKVLQKHGFNNVSSEVLRGDPKLSIQDYCRCVKPTYLLTGTRGYGALKRYLVGSISDYLAKHCPCPVLILKLAKEELEARATFQDSKNVQFAQLAAALDSRQPTPNI